MRKHLANHLAVQEKVVRALLVPLLIGDVFHLYITLWALGEDRWNFLSWSPMLWTTVGLGLTLMIPRILWHLGVGRYVDARDGNYLKTTSDEYFDQKAVDLSSVSRSRGQPSILLILMWSDLTH